MSLEQSIQDLTAAVKDLTQLLDRYTPVQNIVASQPAPEVVKEPKETKKPRSAASSTGPDAVSEQAPAVAEQPSTQEEKTTTDTSPPSEPESAPVTYDDVKKATNALSAAKGRDVTIDALSRFGVKRATELDEGQWADYIAYAEKVIADE